MTGREQDRRRFRPGSRTVAIGGSAAVAVAATAMLLGPVGSALGSPRARPAAVPAGWAPVPYRSAQLSVPGSWLVESPGQLFCAPWSPGMIFAGIRPAIPKGSGCGLTASLAWILPAWRIPPGITHRKPTAVIGGIPVYRLPSGPRSVAYLVPDLGVRVGARGPLARRVLATLTWSPLPVVLRRGPATQAGASWIWHRFGGVRFATPRSWGLQDENQWATCGTGLIPRSLLLINATRPPEYLPCPFPIPTASALRAQPGLTVVAGKYAAKSVGQDFTRCQVRRDVRICLSSVTGQGGFLSSVLIFSVSRPHQDWRTYFLLGLSGSGASARAVFGSISAARR